MLNNMEIIYKAVGIIYTLLFTQSAQKEELALIVSGPENVTKNEGDSAFFSCTLNVEADGTQMNGFIWLKNSVVINPNNTHYIREIDNQSRKCTIEIEKVERTDKGFYQCSVDGEESEKAWLTVMEITGPPYPICEASKTDYKENETVEVKCITENKQPEDVMNLYILRENNNTKITENKSYCHNDTHSWIQGKFKADAKFGNRIQIGCRINNVIYESGRTCKDSVNLNISPELPMNTGKTTTTPNSEESTDLLTIIDNMFSDIQSKLPENTGIYALLITLLLLSIISNILLFCIMKRI